MTMGRSSMRAAPATFLALVIGLLSLSWGTAEAQNRRKSWEVFIYFGQYGGQSVPSVIQTGVVSTYRLDPSISFFDPNNNGEAPCDNPPFCKNLGQTGPDSQFIILDPDPNVPPQGVDVCVDAMGGALPVAFDANIPFYDECDYDIEAKYRYNAQGIVTNGSVERNDSEFVLGARAGYNITNHWEVELDLGFAKQRLDMTRNLIPLLQQAVSNPADPYFAQQAQFFEFTWANKDFLDLGYEPFFNAQGGVNVVRGAQEIPNVPQHRFSHNMGADILAVLPMPAIPSERFQDVTDFVNRVFLDPTAFRNRANQINIDIFSVGLTGVYNFNTKPDSRIVPYLSGGFGKWIRQFDTPYEGENTDYLTVGGGVRCFINEIFAFRMEGRQVLFQDDEMTITAKLPRQNLVDMSFRSNQIQSAGAFIGCVRDQDPPVQEPPDECQGAYLAAYNSNASFRSQVTLPPNSGAGGFASVEFITETDDFWEARIGFDVLLGGR